MQDKMRMTAAVLAAGSTLITATTVDAGGGPIVEGAKVRHGQAKFERNGNSLRIRSGQRTIIDYSRFDIPVGASVEFAQANASSRVLNRINSAAPSQIMGSLSSNGKVYFINPAGVVFGKNARIDVNGLFAGAGRMSDGDFLRGVDRLTDMRGTVRNEGSIKAINEVVLAGRTVVNTGEISTSGKGLVALVAGDTVTLHRAGSRVGVQVAGGAQALQPGGAGVVQHGTIRTPGGRLVATSGDIASLAVDLGGSVVASAIDVDGGARGEVRLSGTLDASGKSNGRPVGGQVRVTAGGIEVTSSASINADGRNGGGTVLVGGGVQGQDATLRNAQRLRVADGAVISADATVNGDGGTIALWSNHRTDFAGYASARGAGASGNGGFVEASGKKHLLYQGMANLLGSGEGSNGTLLIDPGYLTVQNVFGGVDTMSIAQVNAALGVGNLVIQNSGVSQDDGIKWTATKPIVGLNTSSLTLNAVGAGADVLISAAPNFGTWTGDFIAQTQAGDVVVAPLIKRPNGGNITLSAGGGGVVSFKGAGVQTANSNITVNGPALLGVNASFDAGTGNVLFSDSVTGDGVARNLAVNSTGSTTFTGDLVNIRGLTTNVGGTTTIGGDVALNAFSTINDAVFLTAGTHTVTNSSAGSTLFAGTVSGPGSLVVNQGNGLLSFSNTTQAISGIGGLTVNATGGVAFSGKVDGAFDMSINAANVSFNGAVGSVTPLNSITIPNGYTLITAPLVATSGDQRYYDIRLGAKVMPNSSSTLEGANVIVGRHITRSGTGIRNLTVNSPGVFSVAGNVTNIDNLTSDAPGSFSLGGNISLTDQLVVNDRMDLLNTSNIVAVNGITLDDVDAGTNSLTLGSTGTVALNGDLTRLANFTIAPTGNTVLNGSVTGTGTMLFRNPLTVGGVGQNRTVTTAGASNVTFQGTVNGPGNLLVNAGTGTVRFNSTVGATTGLGALTVNSSGAVNFLGTVDGATDLLVRTSGLTTFNASVGANTALDSIQVDGPTLIAGGGTMRTTGNQAYGGAVTLGLDTLLSSLAGGSLALNGTVNGAFDLTATSTGLTTLGGAVGNSTALTSLTIGGPVALNGGSVTTTGAQSYGAATLGTNATLTSTGGGTVDFTSTIDGARSLAIGTTGLTTLGGAVGGTNALTSLGVTGPLALNGGAVTTTGNQTYGGAVTLGSDTTLSSTGGGTIDFTQTLDGAQALAVNNTGGTTRLGGVVGGTLALSQLIVNGATQFDGGSVTTTGQQLYGNATLGMSTTLLSTGGGNIGLSDVAGNGQFLAVHTGGNAAFNGDMGNLLGLLSSAGGSTTIGGDIGAVGDIAIFDDVLLTVGSHDLNSAAGSVFFGSTVDGPGSLASTAAAGTTFTGAVGGNSPLAALLVNGSSTFSGGSATTVGDLSLLGPSLFTASTSLNSGGIITLGGAANAGAFDLSLFASGIRFANGILVSGQNLSFTGPMTALGDVTFNATNTLSLLGDLLADSGQLELGTPSLIVLGGSIDSLNTLFFRSDVRVEGLRSVTVRNGTNAIFEGTVNGTTFEDDTLLVFSSGLTQFQQDVGNSMRMLRLETDHPGTIGVAPSANAIIVIYGELVPPPDPGTGGGAALARSYSSMWESILRLGDSRKMGMVDYRRSGQTLLTADLDTGVATGAFAVSPIEGTE